MILPLAFHLLISELIAMSVIAVPQQAAHGNHSVCYLGCKIAIGSLLPVVCMSIVLRPSVPRLFPRDSHRTLGVNMDKLEKMLLGNPSDWLSLSILEDV